MAAEFAAMPREESVAGSLQQRNGEAKNTALKPAKEEGTEGKPVTG